MSLLRRLLGRSAPETQTGPQVDPCWGDPLAQEWRDRLARGEWRDLGAFLRSQRDAETRDFYVEVLGDTLDGRPAWLDEWVNAEPQAALPLLFRARHAVAWAWQARGGGQASTVKEQGWQPFFERLLGADADAASAAALDPDDPGPWVVMLTTARGLQKGVEQLRETFAEVQKRCRWHQEAHRLMIQGLAEKWGGSDELMFGFAREVNAQAPEGLGVHTVLAEAHIEGWMSAEGEGYWRQPGVRDEVVSAANRYLNSPACVATPRLIRNRNVFAFCFWMLGERDLLRQQMEQIGDTVTSPWTLLRRPAVSFAAARREAQGESQ